MSTIDLQRVLLAMRYNERINNTASTLTIKFIIEYNLQPLQLEIAFEHICVKEENKPTELLYL